MSFLDKMITFKEKFPANGDWLFVTITSKKCDTNTHDLTDEYADLNYLKNDISLINNDSIVKIVYERAKSFESAIYTSSDHVRDKAKTLIGTATFVSAIIFGVAAFYINAISKLNWYIVAIEAIIFFFLVSHMLRALSISIDVMTREGYIKASPSEIIKSSHKISESGYQKEAIAQTIYYANMTHNLLLERINKLIIAQNAYRYGLKYFILIIFVHLISIFNIGKTEDIATKNLSNIESRLGNIQNSQEKISQTLYDISNTAKKIHSNNKAEVILPKQANKSARN